MINLTINGKQITAAEGSTILEAARANGIDIPTLCYDKAVEVVTAIVKKETHLEDIRLVEESKNWVLSPERKASKKEREYAAKRLDGIIAKIKNAMQSAVLKIQNKLMQPEVKRAGTAQSLSHRTPKKGQREDDCACRLYEHGEIHAHESIDGRGRVREKRAFGSALFDFCRSFVPQVFRKAQGHKLLASYLAGVQEIRS